MLSLMRNLLARKTSARRGAARKPAARASLDVESLEERCNPMAIMPGKVLYLSNNASATFATVQRTPWMDNAATWTGATGQAYYVTGTLSTSLTNMPGGSDWFNGWVVDSGHGYSHLQISALNLSGWNFGGGEYLMDSASISGTVFDTGWAAVHYTETGNAYANWWGTGQWYSANVDTYYFGTLSYPPVIH